MKLSDDAAPRAGEPPPASTSGRCLLLLSPTGAGIHSVVRRIRELGLAPVELCVRDSTRPLQPWDNGTLRTVTLQEFHRRLNGHEYLEVIADGSGTYFGTRKTAVKEMLLKGVIPVLRGIPGTKDELRRWFGTEAPGTTPTTVFMTTDPADVWERVVEGRGYDVEGRLQTSRYMLQRLGLTDGAPPDAAILRHTGIDHVVLNRWNDLDGTARAIAALLR